MENSPVKHGTDNVQNYKSATNNVSGTLVEEESLEGQVANCIHGIFDSLPAKCKPRTSINGVSEWIPLSGIAIVRDGAIRCVALGTGMKCLPANQTALLDSRTVLHDWHAEILAIRAFNHFLLQEAYLLASSSTYTSCILRRKKANESDSPSSRSRPYTIHEDLKIMMYCSEAPCGDASMELIMEAQDDATPWPAVPPTENGAQPLLGRGLFSQLGVVRRKPSRPDAPPTLSKSCSDKLALKQCTSLLSTPTSLLISPQNAYIHTLILPSSQHRPHACSRSFGPSGRMAPLTLHGWPQGYAYHPFHVTPTATSSFTYARHNHNTNPTSSSKNNIYKSCNISTVWTPTLQETLINGVLQGRKQMDPKGASALSKTRMWALFQEINGMVGGRTNVPVDLPYERVKEVDALAVRRRVKEETKKVALKGWDG
ncbi:hypothetical protein JMJ35_007309 [Cladonia borealis]|uniref:A to I editase domain-containing protein n=1 Tax=Cladonia borealis TaxID=184061 RepID=A0AA39QXJ7_9LECA|nr:hypothetical protein JMJ35_007309 [Cladonia borealis]